MVQSILINIKSSGASKIKNSLGMVLLFSLAIMETELTKIKGLTTIHKILEKEERKESCFYCFKTMAP